MQTTALQCTNSHVKLKKCVSFCFLCFLLSRLLVLGPAYAVFYAHADPPAPPGYAETQGPLDRKPLNVLYFYDAVHYMRVAREGYTLKETPWYPLYPLLIRLSGGTAASAVAVSNLCFFLGLLALYRLGGEKPVLFACASPIGIVFSSAYSESLFFCIAAWFLVCLEEERLMPAGVLAGLGALSRPPGWVLVGALGIELLRKKRLSARSLVPAAVIGSVYPLYQYFSFGNPFANSRVSEAVFSRHLMLPWWGTLRDLLDLVSGAAGSGLIPIVLLNLVGWVWLAGGMAAGGFSVPGVLYSLFVLSFPITRPGYVHATHGLLRYACAWPGAYLGLAQVCRSKTGTVLVVSLSAVIAVLVSCAVACKIFLF